MLEWRHLHDRRQHEDSGLIACRGLWMDHDDDGIPDWAGVHLNDFHGPFSWRPIVVAFASGRMPEIQTGWKPVLRSGRSSQAAMNSTSASTVGVERFRTPVSE